RTHAWALTPKFGGCGRSATALRILSLDAAPRPLMPQQEQGVSVRIADQQSRPIIPERYGSGRDEADTRCSKPVLQGWQIVDLERGRGGRNVIAAKRPRHPSGGARRSIAEKFKVRWVIRPGIERGHLDHRTRDGIELFLLPAAIERAPGDGKSQNLPIERDA